jgi:hypothetical protein
MEYRLDKTGSVWHFCLGCPDWPSDTFNIVRLKKVPAEFQLCSKCVALKDANTGQAPT